MEKYSVIVDRRIEKSIRQIPSKHRNQLKEALERLSVSPRPQESRKLSKGYRITVGEYRILYTVDDKARQVAVYKIVKRNDYSYRD